MGAQEMDGKVLCRAIGGDGGHVTHQPPTMGIHLALCVDGDVVGLCHCTLCRTERLVDMVHLYGIVPVVSKWHKIAPNAVSSCTVLRPLVHTLEYPR